MYELFVIFRYYNNFLEGEFILYRHKILPYEVSSQFFLFFKDLHNYTEDFVKNNAVHKEEKKLLKYWYWKNIVYECSRWQTILLFLGANILS